MKVFIRLVTIIMKCGRKVKGVRTGHGKEGIKGSHAILRIKK